MLNDYMLGHLGVHPALVSVGLNVGQRIFGGAFGPSASFQDRQKYRNQIGDLLHGYRAAARELPAHQAAIVNQDLDELKRRVNRDDLDVSDYIDIIKWLKTRVNVWEQMGAPAATIPYVPPPPGYVPPGYVPPGQPAPVYEPTPTFETAGFPMWLIALIVGGLLVGPKLLKGR